MAEIIYIYESRKPLAINSHPRWLGANGLEIFNEHLTHCGQKSTSPETWDNICAEGTMYCLLFVDGIPAARACVEKYSDDKWEVGDVRVVKEYRNRGLAYEACVFVLNYILENGKQPTIRTEEDNIPMQYVINRMGFRPL